MKKIIFIIMTLFLLAGCLQANSEIGRVAKIINNYVLIDTGYELGGAGVEYDVYRLVGFDYQRIARVSIVKPLQNGIAAKTLETFNFNDIQVGDVLLQDDYSAMSATEFSEPMSGTPLERLGSLEHLAPVAAEGQAFGKTPLEKLAALEGAAK